MFWSKKTSTSMIPMYGTTVLYTIATVSNSMVVLFKKGSTQK